MESGKHYNYFRDYDPGIGRYIESDPIGLLGGFDTYSYVDSNPLLFFDQGGLARGGGKSYRPDFWLRPCNPTEKADCVAFCKKQGKAYESCTTTWKMGFVMRGDSFIPQAFKVPGSWSCKCKDDEDSGSSSKGNAANKTCDGTCKTMAAGLAALLMIFGQMCLP